MQRNSRRPRCASAGSRYATVEPVPRPTRMPSRTSAAAASAAARFWAPDAAPSLSAGSAPPTRTTVRHGADLTEPAARLKRRRSGAAGRCSRKPCPTEHSSSRASASCLVVSMPTAIAVRLACLASAIVAANIARFSLSRSKLATRARSSFTMSNGRLLGSPSEYLPEPNLSSAIDDAQALDVLQRRAGALGVALHRLLAHLEAQCPRLAAGSRRAPPPRAAPGRARSARARRCSRTRAPRCPCAATCQPAGTRCAAPSCRSGRSARSPPQVAGRRPAGSPRSRRARPRAVASAPVPRSPPPCLPPAA